MGTLSTRIGRAWLVLLRRLNRFVSSALDTQGTRVPLPASFRVKSQEGVLTVTDDQAKTVAVAHEMRLRLYRAGVDRRLRSLVRQYCFPDDFFDTPRVFVDVGANAGEFGMVVEATGGTYIAFEPDPDAFAALRFNVTSERVFQLALSDQPGQATFFLKPESGDSSLAKPLDFDGESMTIPVETLDRVSKQNAFPSSIDVLKVEAEGMEPEVLRGAVKLISRVEWLAVDAGPERYGESTAPEVFTCMYEKGFELVNLNLERGTFLFRNTTRGKKV